MKVPHEQALYDLRRMLRDTLRDQLWQRHDERAEQRTEGWYACVGLARECIASLRLLDELERTRAHACTLTGFWP